MKKSITLCGILLFIITTAYFFTLSKEHEPLKVPGLKSESISKEKRGVDNDFLVQSDASLKDKKTFLEEPVENKEYENGKGLSAYRKEFKKKYQLKENGFHPERAVMESNVQAKPSTSVQRPRISSGRHINKYALPQTGNMPEGADEYGQEDTEIFDDNVNIVRVIEAGDVSQGELDILLMVDVDNAPSGLIVEEHIPSGWSLESSSPTYKYINASDKIKWLFVGSGVGSMQIRYKLKRNSPSEHSVTFNGEYTYKSMIGKHIKRQTLGAERA